MKEMSHTLSLDKGAVLGAGLEAFSARRIARPGWRVLGLLGLAAWVVCGCGGGPKPVLEGSSISERIPAPKAPIFLTGPISALLTNVEGFSAHAVLQLPAPKDKPKTLSGELLGRGGRLLFAMDPPRDEGKRSRLAGISFLWDVASRTGYILSEPMQGCAPVAADPTGTNLVLQQTATRPAPEAVEGHRCDLADLTATAGDSTTTLQVWKAKDLKGFPVRVSSSQPTTITLTFSKIRLEPPPSQLFLVPEGFASYDNSEAMMSEMAVRQAVAQKKAKADWRKEAPEFEDQGRMSFGR